jgi:hypothetical protein
MGAAAPGQPVLQAPRDVTPITARLADFAYNKFIDILIPPPLPDVVVAGRRSREAKAERDRRD